MRPSRPFFLWSLAVLVVLTGFRLLAWLLYARVSELQSSELVSAFLMGFRFDLSAVCYALSLPALILAPVLCLGLTRYLQKINVAFRIYLTLISILFVFLSFINLVYYTYFQDHLNIMIFGFFEDDTQALVATLWKNYPALWILLGLAVTSFAIWKLLGRAFHGTAEVSPATAVKATSRQIMKRASVAFVIMLILALGARGSLGLFPLGVADATISSKPFVNYLAFSGLHSLHRAVKLRLRENAVWNINAKTYGYESARAAAQDFLGSGELPPSEDPLVWFQKTIPSLPAGTPKSPHVVVLMMESFGSYWLTLQSPQFDLMGDLKKHFEEDLVFKNFVPSMTATIGSLSALMINTPHRPEGGFLTENRYLQVQFRTAPARLYKEAGYRTRFVYGGAVGWRDIDKFARTQGFESVEGDFEIERQLGRKIEKHDWGLYDEDVLDYVQKTLEGAQGPELIVVMTTTNHPPYQLPPTYKAKPLTMSDDLKARLNVDVKLAQSRFSACQYSNQKLGEFLTQLKASPLADKTILAATGDHGFLIVNFDDTSLLQKWQVPFYLYLPPTLRPKDVDTEAFGSHADLFPTLMSLSLPGKTVPMIGKNLLDPAVRHEAYHFSRLALSKQGAVVVENARRTRFFEWEQERQSLVPAPPRTELEEMAARYKALMSFLDEYYEYERKHGPKSSL
ncbi:MAG: LTA synthase family protein [Bdellovibrio sp.]